MFYSLFLKNITVTRVCFPRFGGGLVMDIKRKAKYYISDFVDALNSQCLASVLFIYFACLAPIVTFGGVMETKTNKYMVGDSNALLTSFLYAWITLYSSPFTVNFRLANTSLSRTLCQSHAQDDYKLYCNACRFYGPSFLSYC